MEVGDLYGQQRWSRAVFLSPGLKSCLQKQASGYIFVCTCEIASYVRVPGAEDCSVFKTTSKGSRQGN